MMMMMMKVSSNGFRSGGGGGVRATSRLWCSDRVNPTIVAATIFPSSKY